MEQPITDAGQRKRALHPNQSFIVQAPAGSGKTDLLIKRFLLLLSDCQTPEEILAITFTRKATLEMRDRIIKEISPRSQLDTKKQTDNQLQNLANKVIQQDKKLNWQLLENPRRLRILTIDALCFDLVRSMPWSSRFGAVPTLLEKHQALPIYKEAVIRTIRHVELNHKNKQTAPDQFNHLLQLVNMNIERAQSLLIGMLKKRDQWIRGLQARTRKDYESIWRNIIETEIKNALDSIPSELWLSIISIFNHAKHRLTSDNQTHPAHNWMDLPKDKQTDTQYLASLKGLCFLLLTKGGTFRKQTNKTHGFPTQDTQQKAKMTDVLEQLIKIDGLEHKLALLQTLPEAEFTDQHWRLLSSLLKLLPLAVAELQLLFRETGHCDYTEISQRAENALGELGQPSDLALLMDHKIHHILMDEVQDTSVAQISLLTELTKGWENGDGRTLFFVGDPMQSIYRFRDAEVSNFLRLQTSGLGQLTLHNITLTSNFRSVETIINWCNHTFSDVFPKQSNMISGAVEYQSSTAIKQSNNVSQDVYLHSCSVDQDINQIVINIISNALEKNKQYSIGILARNRSHLIAISHALTDAAIDYQAIELETILQRSATQDLLSLTRALLDVNDRIAWLSILRAPWCGMTIKDLTLLCGEASRDIIWQSLQNTKRQEKLSADGQQRAEKIVNAIKVAMQMRHSHDISKCLMSAWLKLGGPACIKPNDLLDCENYFDMLNEMETNQTYVDALSLEQQAGNIWSERINHSNIQMLTMHKAKGLEFDVVILPELHRKGRNDDSLLLRWSRLSPEKLLFATLPHKNDETGSEQKKYDYLKQIQQHQTKNELARLLYVACTRAKNQLHLLFSLQQKKDDETKNPDHSSLLSTLWPAIAPQFKQIKFTAGNNNIKNNDSDENNPDNNIRQLQRVAVDWQPNPLPTDLQPKKAFIEQVAKADEKIEFSWTGESLRVSGIAIHYLLDQFASKNWRQWQSTSTQTLVNIGYQILLNNGLVTHSALSTATKHIKDAIENIKQDPRALWIFSNQHTEIHSEWPLTAWLGQQLVNIKIDRSFVDENNVRWIIDFKSSQHKSSDMEHFLNQEKQRYCNQLTRYGQIVRLLDQREIKLALYFPLMQKWIAWDYDK